MLREQRTATSCTQVDLTRRKQLNPTFCSVTTRTPALHLAAIAAAESEIAAARAADEARRQSAQAELDRARAAFAAVPIAPAVSSAADLLGWSAIVLNALLAGLKATSINIGAIFALAYAGHHPRHPAHSDDAEHPRDQVARFALDSYDNRSGAELRLGDALSHYVAWCRTAGVRPLPQSTFEREFAALARQSRVPVTGDGSEMIIQGMAPRLRLAA